MSIPSVPSASSATGTTSKSVKFDIPTIINTPSPDDQQEGPAGHDTSTHTGTTVVESSGNEQVTDTKTIGPPGENSTTLSTSPPQPAVTSGTNDNKISNEEDPSALDNMFKDILDFSLPTTQGASTDRHSEDVTSIEL